MHYSQTSGCGKYPQEIQEGLSSFMLLKSTSQEACRVETNPEQLIVHGSNHVARDRQLVQVIQPIECKVQVVMIGPGHHHNSSFCNLCKALPVHQASTWTMLLEQSTVLTAVYLSDTAEPYSVCMFPALSAFQTM